MVKVKFSDSTSLALHPTNFFSFFSDSTLPFHVSLPTTNREVSSNLKTETVMQPTLEDLLEGLPLLIL